MDESLQQDKDVNPPIPKQYSGHKKLSEDTQSFHSDSPSPVVTVSPHIEDNINDEPILNEHSKTVEIKSEKRQNKVDSKKEKSKNLKSDRKDRFDKLEKPEKRKKEADPFSSYDRRKKDKKVRKSKKAESFEFSDEISKKTKKGSHSHSRSSSSSNSEKSKVECVVIGKLSEEQLKHLVRSYGYRLINEEEYVNLITTVKKMEKQLFKIISDSSTSSDESYESTSED
ncbi:hypothetical protein QTN25_000137 [Entamoeba marina]